MLLITTLAIISFFAALAAGAINHHPALEILTGVTVGFAISGMICGGKP